MRHRFWASVLFVAVGVSVGGRAASGQVVGSFERRLEVSGPVRLEVTTGSGSISVRPAGDGEVHVSGSIRVHRSGWMSESEAEEKVAALEASPPIEQRGDTVRIGYGDDEELLRGVSISYEIEVPERTELESRTGSGSQTIGDLAGPVYAASGSGSLTIGAIGSEVEASTGSGAIRVVSAGGALTATTGSGSIRADGVSGPIRCSSGSGSIELTQTGPGDVEIRTGSGSIRVQGVRGGLRARTGSGSIDVEGQMAGDWRLHASSGSITVRLPSDAAFELQARAHSGRVASDHPVTVLGRLGRRRIEGTVRGGGPVLEASTNSGRIEIR